MRLLIALTFFLVDCSCASKRGMAWSSSADKIELFTQQNSVISWVYNWSPRPMNSTGGLEFVPMQWNGNNINQFADLSNGASHVLAFNEPDYKDQANMKATDAANLWKQYFIPLRSKGIKIGAPAVTNNGLDWLADFFKACGGVDCKVDFIPLHWYGTGPGIGVGPFYDFIWSAKGRFGNYTSKFWITEFAETTWDPKEVLTDDQVYAFMNASLIYLDSLDWIERYSWFGAFRDLGSLGNGARLIDSNGKLTKLGCLYAYNGDCSGKTPSPTQSASTLGSTSGSAPLTSTSGSTSNPGSQTTSTVDTIKSSAMAICVSTFFTVILMLIV